MKVITEDEMKEIIIQAREIYDNTTFTAVEALRIAKGMIDDEKKMVEKTY